MNNINPFLAFLVFVYLCIFTSVVVSERNKKDKELFHLRKELEESHKVILKCGDIVDMINKIFKREETTK